MEALRQTYLYLESYHAARGIFPTQRETGAALGVSSDVVRYRLEEMQRVGWLRRDKYKKQAMVLLGMK